MVELKYKTDLQVTESSQFLSIKFKDIYSSISNEPLSGVDKVPII